jgi:hypothetical protein
VQLKSRPQRLDPILLARRCSMSSACAADDAVSTAAPWSWSVTTSRFAVVVVVVNDQDNDAVE